MIHTTFAFLLTRRLRELTRALGIRDTGGAIRVSLAPYTAESDLDRVVAAMAAMVTEPVRDERSQLRFGRRSWRGPSRGVWPAPGRSLVGDGRESGAPFHVP